MSELRHPFTDEGEREYTSDCVHFKNLVRICDLNLEVRKLDLKLKAEEKEKEGKSQD